MKTSEPAPVTGYEQHGTALLQIRTLLADFVPVAADWLAEDGSFCDPYETIYSENYAPANAAVLFAAVYRASGDASVLRLLRAALDRSVVLLQDREISPFCRVFLIHYSLMAITMLDGQDREEAARDYGTFMAAYEDDCQIINTNCAALQLGTELFLDTLGYRDADMEHLNRRITFIERAQLQSGFINDEISELQVHDGMPIAYHAFTLYILTSVISVLPLAWKESHQSLHNRTQQLIRRGLGWLNNTISSDGTFAMVERSSYQTFTWGAFSSLYSYCGMQEEGMLERIIQYWVAFRHPDGSLGCTPNTLPHSLRVGYESYTHLNMYNLLGLTGLATAGLILERRLSLQSDCRLPANNNFIDTESGYAFLRRGESFFGCTLRMHNREYAPAMQGFHYRLAGRKLPLAEPRLTGYQQSALSHVQDGVWEGYLLRGCQEDEGLVSDAPDDLVYPNSQINAALTPVANGFQLAHEDDNLRCVKTIQMLEDGFAWQYQLDLERPFRTCEHVVSLLVHDGEHELRIRRESPQRLILDFAGDRYSLECSAAADMNMRLERSTLSVSGISAQLRITLVLPPDGGPQVVSWRTTLRQLAE